MQCRVIEGSLRTKSKRKNKLLMQTQPNGWMDRVGVWQCGRQRSSVSQMDELVCLFFACLTSLTNKQNRIERSLPRKHWDTSRFSGGVSPSIGVYQLFWSDSKVFVPLCKGQVHPDERHHSHCPNGRREPSRATSVASLKNVMKPQTWGVALLPGFCGVLLVFLV